MKVNIEEIKDQLTPKNISFLSCMDIKDQKYIINLFKSQKVKNFKDAKKKLKARKKDFSLIREKHFGYELICADVRNINGQIKDNSVDWIITDPPYPKEYLSLYDNLAQFSKKALKDGGSLICMVGQSYLPEIISMLSKELNYHWVLSYLTPGGQATQLWQRNVNTFWKPLLWFVKGEYKGDWIGDVCKSKVNDNDKRFHNWGQSESGIVDIIERFTYPKELIVDPFVGGGTIGYIAVKMKRRFIGIDIDKECVEITKKRLKEIKNNTMNPKESKNSKNSDIFKDKF